MFFWSQWKNRLALTSGLIGWRNKVIKPYSFTSIEFCLLQSNHIIINTQIYHNIYIFKYSYRQSKIKIKYLNLINYLFIIINNILNNLFLNKFSLDIIWLCNLERIFYIVFDFLSCISSESWGVIIKLEHNRKNHSNYGATPTRKEWIYLCFCLNIFLLKRGVNK